MDSAPRSTASNLEREHTEEQDRGGQNLEMPADGHAWRKYGQKFIQRIRKNRSYFKCRENGCTAKKRVEWPPSDPSSIRITYEGAHNHPSSPQDSAADQEAQARMANRYNLVIQMSGVSGDPS